MSTPALQSEIRTLRALIPYVSGPPLVDQVRLGTLGVAVNVVTGAAGNEFTVTHPLGRVPVGYIVIRKTGPVDVYDPADGVVRWNTSTMILRASGSATVTLLLL